MLISIIVKGNVHCVCRIVTNAKTSNEFTKSSRWLHLLMDFGRVPLDQLSTINFSLSKEPYWNSKVLTGSKAGSKVYVGLDKWGRKELIGKLYPHGTKDARFLDEYSKHYNAVELNATHYKFYNKVEIERWVNKVKADFIFCPKFHQAITHKGNLLDKQFLTTTFLESMKPFGQNLGPFLLQLSDKFSPKRKEELVSFLTRLPKEFTYFLEARHPDWFHSDHFDELLFELTRLNIGLVITDTLGRRDCCHMHLTIPKSFIRFVSNDGHATDYKRMDDWIQRIKYWLSQGLEALYFFIDAYQQTPELSKYFIENLNKECGLHLREIKLISNR